MTEDCKPAIHKEGLKNCKATKVFKTVRPHENTKKQQETTKLSLEAELRGHPGVGGLVSASCRR